MAASGPLFLLATILLLTVLSGCGPRYEVTETRVPIRLGKDTVTVVVHQAEAPGTTFINLHDNENTAAQAARTVIGYYGGRLIELQHTDERNVTFELDDSTYVFDPNRIFTDAGITATLDTLSTHSDTAHAAVRAFADTLLTLYDLDAAGTVVTVHNNGDTEYSALSYVPGGDYEIDALFAYIAEGSDPDDFFFVTEQSLYDALRNREVNVVMQDNARVTDDGSLSVYCGQRGLTYVNVEAQHGHLRQQVRMIEILLEVLGRVGDEPPA